LTQDCSNELMAGPSPACGKGSKNLVQLHVDSLV
jgi:hypothetical protein